MNDNTLRTFIAFDIDEKLRQSAADIINYLRKQHHGKQIKWAKPEKIHVTLRFLGDIKLAQIDEISQRVADEIQAIKPFQVELGSVQTIPKHRPHVIIISIHLSDELAELAQAIERSVSSCGISPDKRPFLPHLTLGRLQNRHCPPLDTIPINLPTTLAVNEVILYQSKLTSEGSIYTALKRVELKYRG